MRIQSSRDCMSQAVIAFLSDSDMDLLSEALHELLGVKVNALKICNESLPPGATKFGVSDFAIDRINSMLDKLMDAP